MQHHTFDWLIDLVSQKFKINDFFFQCFWKIVKLNSVISQIVESRAFQFWIETIAIVIDKRSMAD